MLTQMVSHPQASTAKPAPEHVGIMLHTNHQGADMLVTLTAGPVHGDPWAYRVTVEFDGTSGDNNGYADAVKAHEMFATGMGYACTDRDRGERCSHFG